MSQPIRFSDQNTAGVIVPLIPFNCVLDIDFGLLSLIYREYFDTKVFSVDFFNAHKKIKDMVYALVNRSDENPLIMAMNNKNDLDLANSLYNDFISKKYDQILKYSMLTELYSAIEIFRDIGKFPISLVCEKESEINKLKSLPVTKGMSSILIQDIKSLDKYQQIYFKSKDDTYIKLMCRFINAKDIYMARYPFNISYVDSNNGKESIATSPYTDILTLNRNVFFSFDIYNKNKLQGDKNNATNL